MSYEPITNSPITADVIARVADKVAEKNNLRDGNGGFVYPVYVEQGEDWRIAGPKIMAWNNDFSENSVEDHFFETDGIINEDLEPNVLDRVRQDFIDELEAEIQQLDVNAPYNAVEAQISEEADSFADSVMFNWREPIELAKEGAEDFVDGVGLTFAQAKPFSDFLAQSYFDGFTPDEIDAHIGESVYQYPQYALYNVQADNLIQIIANGRGENKEDIENQFKNGDDFDSDKIEKALREVDIDTVGEYFGKDYTADYHNGILVTLNK